MRRLSHRPSTINQANTGTASPWYLERQDTKSFRSVWGTPVQTHRDLVCTHKQLSRPIRFVIDTRTFSLPRGVREADKPFNQNLVPESDEKAIRAGERREAGTQSCRNPPHVILHHWADQWAGENESWPHLVSHLAQLIGFAASTARPVPRRQWGGRRCPGRCGRHYMSPTIFPPSEPITELSRSRNGGVSSVRRNLSPHHHHGGGDSRRGGEGGEVEAG